MLAFLIKKWSNVKKSAAVLFRDKALYFTIGLKQKIKFIVIIVI